MRYEIKLPNPNNHLINICLHVDNVDTDELNLQLPAWRPGRYEIGNFAKNIQSLKVKDSNNRNIPFKKITKDLWRINTKKTSSVAVEYNFYAHELNAGSCLFSAEQLYVNGVQCFLYNPNKMQQQHKVELHLPNGWQLASSLPHSGNVLIASDYHELVDSPFIASPSLQHRNYTVANTKFHIWVQGETKLDWDRIIKDFSRFSEYQIGVMGSLPVNEYHFLIQAPDIKAYHGVEHLANTVLYFGPAANIMEDEFYPEFLGLASHELFHSWNIKAIRPIEWFPYNYAKENYSALGYVAEGVTTYIGDKFLYSSGVFGTDQYLKELSKQIQKHIDNFGRFYMPVTQASIDSWIDGYTLGVPHRKTSIYTEGALISFMLDLMIMKHSGFKNSLETVMRSMYENYAKKNIGYSEQDYITECETAAGVSLKSFFDTYVYGADSFEFELSKIFDWLGLRLVYSNSSDVFERFGIKTVKRPEGYMVLMVAPDSPAENASISQKDILILKDEDVNLTEEELNNKLKDDNHTFGFKLQISEEQFKDIELKKHVGTEYYRKVKLTFEDNMNNKQKEFYEKWSRVKLLEKIV